MSGILIHFDDPPRVEYVTDDRVVVHRRVDDRMDVLLDMHTREVCGFTLYEERKPRRSLLQRIADWLDGPFP